MPAAGAFPCFVIGLLVFPLCGGAPTFLCWRQRKVGAPPHRGNANKPITKEKATAAGEQTTSTAQATGNKQTSPKVYLCRASCCKVNPTSNIARSPRRRDMKLNSLNQLIVKFVPGTLIMSVALLTTSTGTYA